MSRLIDFYVMVDNRPMWVTPAIRDLLGYKQDEKTSALKVGGTGMDMCFHDMRDGHVVLLGDFQVGIHIPFRVDYCCYARFLATDEV
jgi:hypothetical protein